MTDQSKADQPLDVEEAAVNLDRAMRHPARSSDALGDFFDALGAAAREMARQEGEARELLRVARNADPVTRANRSRGAHQGWKKRRAREARERLLDDIGDVPVRTGPGCDEMNHNSIGSEVFCQLEPGHDEDHDDDYGTTWPQED
ncbi:hypothetical protein ACIA71_01745 [Streptomyces anulatus]